MPLLDVKKNIQVCLTFDLFYDINMILIAIMSLIVKRGDTCHEITHKFGIHLEDFYYWNPQVNSRCKNLKPGRKYCVKNSDAGASPDSCNVRHKGMHDNASMLHRMLIVLYSCSCCW